MTSRTLTLIGIVGILLISGGLFYFSAPGVAPGTPGPGDNGMVERPAGAAESSLLTPEESRAPARRVPISSEKSGRVVVFLTDIGISLDGMESIRMTVDEISVASAQGGWIALASAPREVDLMALYRTSSFETMADVNLEEVTYDRVRMKVSKVTVVEKGSGGIVRAAKLPSGTMMFIGNLVVQKAKSSSLVIDVLAAQVLHKTGNGTFIFFPVVKVAMQSGVSVQSLGGGAYATGGKSDFDVTVGMDETGTMKPGFTFESGTEFEFLGNVIRVIPHGREAGRYGERPGRSGRGSQERIHGYCGFRADVFARRHVRMESVRSEGISAGHGLCG